MRNLKAAILSGLFCWLTSHALGQLIKGEVHDKTSHAPLSGASISIPTVKKGIATDASGTFSIDLHGAKTFTVSAVGYKPQLITVTESNFYPIDLELSDQSLGQVVVVG